MRILLINHYAGSLQHGMEFRPFYFAREWVRLGNQVTIVGASESHIRANNPTVRCFWRRQFIEGIEYLWFRTPKYKGNGLGRILNMLIFLVWIVLAIPFFVFFVRPEVVIASSTYPLDVLPAWFLSRLVRARLVFEVHDLWPLSPIEIGGMSRWHPFIMVMQFAENFAYRVCDRCVSLLPKALEYMLEHGLAAEKFLYVPNGIDAAEWSSDSEPISVEVARSVLEFRKRHRFLLGYVGTHGLANALYTLCASASGLRSDGVGIVLIGSGPEKESLIRSVTDANNSDDVLFLPPVGKKQVPAVLGLFDALYIGAQNQPIYRFGISPNKLYDYMMAGKPIVFAILAGNDPVADAECGVSVPPECEEELVRAVRKLIGCGASRLEEMGSRATKYVLREHNLRFLAERMLGNL